MVGNAGIVTEFVFRLAPVGQILGGELMLPASREVLRGYLDYAAAAPDDLTTIANLMYAPPAPVPAACWQTGALDPCQLTATFWPSGALAPLRALATPIADAVAPMPYPQIYRFTEHQAAPHAASIRMMFADELSDAALGHRGAGGHETGLVAVQPDSVPRLGGAMARVANDATAFAHRERRYARGNHRALARCQRGPCRA